jgi:hypothetical protein
MAIIYWAACLQAFQVLRDAATKTYTAAQAELHLIAAHRMTPEDMLLTLRELLGLQEAWCHRTAFKVNGKHTNRYGKHTFLMHVQTEVRLAKLPIDLGRIIGRL